MPAFGQVLALVRQLPQRGGEHGPGVGGIDDVVDEAPRRGHLRRAVPGRVVALEGGGTRAT